MKQLIGIALAIGILAVASCGGGDDADDDSGGDTAAACDAFIAYSQAFDINEDLEGGIAALKDFAAAVPTEIGAALAPTIRQLEEDPEPILEGLDPVPGEQEAQQYVLDHCGDTTVNVDAYNMAFVGVPTEIEAGRVVFNMVNRTQTGEYHEALLLRQHDGVAESPLDQLNTALGETLSVEATFNAISQFDLVAVGYVEPEGPGTDYVFAADLTPGNYIMTCLLPEESAEHLEAYFNGDEITGEHRHHELGMFAQFTVR